MNYGRREARTSEKGREANSSHATDGANEHVGEDRAKKSSRDKRKKSKRTSSESGSTTLPVLYRENNRQARQKPTQPRWR